MLYDDKASSQNKQGTEMFEALRVASVKT